MRSVRLPFRLTVVVAPVSLAGAAVAAYAILRFAESDPRGGVVAEVLGILAAAIAAEHFPVAVQPRQRSIVTLGFVFAVATTVLFGWPAGVIVGAFAPLVVQAAEHRPVSRVVYNGPMFALAAAAGGAAVSPLHGSSAAMIAARVATVAAANFVVNALLLAAVVAVAEHKTFAALLRVNVERTFVGFALMASAALMFVVLWQRTPAFAAALAGPLIGIALYQRSTFRELHAMRLALTDPLTGLGNHRHFHERLQRELLAAEEGSSTLALCVLDVDDFKRINDRHGHPVGDQVLTQVAARLRQGGEAFRLGGDEFALLLPGHDESRGLEVATAVVERLAELELDAVGGITVSAGVAAFPAHGSGRDELVRLADSALYWAKERGKNRVHAYRPDVVELADAAVASAPDRAARYRAAASLASAVDARDAYDGSHSERVGVRVAQIAEQLGLSAEEIELCRLAGSLHDLGKLAVPEEILRKPGALTDAERLVLERHPQIGYRMLETLSVDPVADWVLHHHERWDGLGYPDGLRGDEIPLGARIVFVADAFDAMTSDRSYRARLTQAEAIAELQRCAGTQFDPAVVAALVAESGVSAGGPLTLVSA